MRVLVVEDDPKVRGLLRRGLEQEGFTVACASGVAEARWQVGEGGFDALVLDIRLPDGDGFALCERLRAEGTWSPILMLTARDDVADRVRGLDSGADDYLVKPFHISEVAARLRALVRRGRRERPAVITIGDLRLDPARHEVYRDGTRIELTPREFALLHYLMSYPDQTLSRRRLLTHVWDDGVGGDLHVVSVYVAYLREKIDKPFGRRTVRTVRGVGYRLSDELAEALD